MSLYVYYITKTSMEHSAVGFDDPTLIDPLSPILNNLTQELEASDNISVPLDLKVTCGTRLLLNITYV